MVIEWDDGEILLDSESAKVFGFTSDLFDGWLWKKGESIYLSHIESRDPGEGNLARLVKRILDHGFTVKVPTPLPSMQTILEAWGFEHIREWNGKIGARSLHYDVWLKQPEKK